jgi:hypothetical protein
MIPPWTNSDMVWYGQKRFFFNFCYLNRVEHEKYSEMMSYRCGIRFKIFPIVELTKLGGQNFKLEHNRKIFSLKMEGHLEPLL